MDIKERKQLRAEVKRVNTRIATIAKKFGLESQTYKNTIAPYLNKSTASVTHYTKQGIMQIDANKKALEKQGMKALVKTALRTVPTLTKIREKVVNKILQEFGEDTKIEKLSQKQAIDLYEKSEKVETEVKKSVNFLYDNYTTEEMEELFPEIYEKRGRRLTYAEIDTFLDRVYEQAKKDDLSDDLERSVFD